MEKLPSVLGLSSLTAKETYPRGEDAGSRADPIEDMDLRIEDATGDDEVYSDSPPSAYDRARNKGLQDAARLESSDHDTFEPETPARTWTSTTLESGSSPRHALSPSHSNLTYASTSSLSLHDDTESSSNAGLPPANASSYSMTTNDNHSSILDPVTYQALKRKNSEADAKRVERERQDRSRQLDLLDRLQEQAENPHLRYVDNRGQVMPDKRPEANRKASSPLVPRGDNVHKGIGLGAPPVFSADSANNTPEVKKR